ncbi:MAG: hypothetical protein HN704_11690 [Bacteroidetes bacterium]|jgi:hypothetical protein|nr:hypothetical protein [Bacteroidota bacterium]MBT6685221.1 hypothetical protein [Bacteroidota bacterium]MBT7142289.1 hypothetical protein [Bacteroidota bacterium]MBT7492253.1 hypothetical protein [Bacteroidota bacterium]
MKIKKYLFIAVVSSIIIFTNSCKKDEQPEPSNTEIITEKSWHISDIKLSPGISVYGLTITDGDMFIEECVRDNQYTFNPDYTTTMNEGATKCDENAEQEIQEGIWKFNEDETKMIFSGSVLLDSMDMESLTAEELILSRIESLPDTTITIPNFPSITIPGGDQKLTITFKH